MAKLNLNIERTCKVCGASFRPATLESFYCSSQCSKIAWSRRKYEEKTKEMREHLKKLGETSNSFLSITQIIETYGVSRSSIYRWLRKGGTTLCHSRQKKLPHQQECLGRET